MNNYSLYLTAILSLLFLSQKAEAGLIFYDSFDYSTGTLAPSTTTPTNGSWLALNSGTAPVVTTGNLDVTGLQASSGNSVSWVSGNIQEAFMRFSPSTTSGLLYYSFAFQLTAAPTSTTYSFALVENGGTTGFAATVMLRSATGGFNIGLNNRTTSTAVYANDVFALNTKIFVVGAYEFVAGTGNDISRLWINPSTSDFNSLASPTATISATGGTDIAAGGLDGFLLRGASGSPSGQMDELRLGTTWADVTPVPEPSSSMLMVVGLAGLIGIRAMRRKDS